MWESGGSGTCSAGDGSSRLALARATAGSRPRTSPILVGRRGGRSRHDRECVHRGHVDRRVRDGRRLSRSAQRTRGDAGEVGAVSSRPTGKCIRHDRRTSPTPSAERGDRGSHRALGAASRQDHEGDARVSDCVVRDVRGRAKASRRGIANSRGNIVSATPRWGASIKNGNANER
jgi:hypothetical protein